MSLTRLSLDISTRHQYNISIIQISTRIMYDDYEIDQAFNNESYAYDLDEMCEHHYHMRDHQYAYLRDMSEGYEHNDDDDYARDSCDYDALAYRHYA